ncbi:MAG: hypothetical protein ACLRRF_06920 [Clostridium fessum]
MEKEGALCGGAGVKTVSERCACQPQPAGAFDRVRRSVLTADSVPGIENVDLSHSRLDVVNNYHARMLASAVLAAQSQNLEYVQFVSFGCGHDAYLSDEIQRMMREISGKSPADPET